eukprot:gene11029-23052_t
MESQLASQIKQAFGESSLYDILGISSSATNADIKKAYKKLALIHHPDKGGDPEKFKALSAIHVILSDPEKRKLYDSNGELDGTELSDEARDWYDYFRTLFPKVTTTAIDDFSNSYKGSSEEREDILRTYDERGGDFHQIMECIMLAEESDEERIMQIIDEAIESEEITSTKTYEKYKKSINTFKSRKSKKSDKNSHSTSTSTKKSKTKDDNIENDPSLQAMILNRQKNSPNIFASIMKKYATEEEEFEDIPDDVFASTQARVMQEKSNKKSTTNKGIKSKSGKRG